MHDVAFMAVLMCWGQLAPANRAVVCLISGTSEAIHRCTRRGSNAGRGGRCAHKVPQYIVPPPQCAVSGQTCCQARSQTYHSIKHSDGSLKQAAQSHSHSSHLQEHMLSHPVAILLPAYCWRIALPRLSSSIPDALASSRFSYATYAMS